MGKVRRRAHREGRPYSPCSPHPTVCARARGPRHGLCAPLGRPGPAQVQRAAVRHQGHPQGAGAAGAAGWTGPRGTRWADPGSGRLSSGGAGGGGTSQEAAILQQEQERTKGERDILVALAAQAQARTTSQFLVKLHCAFQDAQDLFLVLDYCPGGDLANQARGPALGHRAGGWRRMDPHPTRRGRGVVFGRDRCSSHYTRFCPRPPWRSTPRRLCWDWRSSIAWACCTGAPRGPLARTVFGDRAQDRREHTPMRRVLLLRLRDLKPENILIDAEGAPVGPRPAPCDEPRAAHDGNAVPAARLCDRARGRPRRPHRLWAEQDVSVARIAVHAVVLRHAGLPGARGAAGRAVLVRRRLVEPRRHHLRDAHRIGTLGANESACGEGRTAARTRADALRGPCASAALRCSRRSTTTTTKSSTAACSRSRFSSPRACPTSQGASFPSSWTRTPTRAWARG